MAETYPNGNISKEEVLSRIGKIEGRNKDERDCDIG